MEIKVEKDVSEGEEFLRSELDLSYTVAAKLYNIPIGMLRLDSACQFQLRKSTSHYRPQLNSVLLHLGMYLIFSCN